MKRYREIQDLIDNEFEQYITDLFTISGEQRKYFYWSVDYFENVGGLSFKHYALNLTQKDSINNFGETYFKSKDVQFIVNKNSHRNDITIKNIHKLFSEERKTGQTAIYEYIKEYILWKLLIEVNGNLSEDLKKLKGQFSEEAKQKSDKKKEELGSISDIIDKQKVNFLITYISYLCNEYLMPIHKYFTVDYTNYLLTIPGENLIKKLDELDREYIYDSKTKKEIKKLNQDLNPKLRKKIDKLYVLKREEPKLQFVFSRNGGGAKEELRELLEIMGKKDTGKLYRGQTNSSWILDASITRELKFKNAEAEMYYEVLSLKPDAFQNDKTVYERLITMQHYGMPTRLLDITRNPLVAIFFACNNWEAKNIDSTIYTFEQPKKKSDFLNFEDKKLDYLPYLFNQINEVKNKKEAEKFLSKIWFIRGVAKNQRINNQSGDFIFVGNGKNVKKELHNLPKMSIIIDSKTKKILLEQLESLNIHGGAVYPDLTNLSTYIKYKYENNPISTIAELVKETQQDKTKVSTDTKQTKTTQTTIKAFDFKTIKTKDRKSQISTFAEFYNLDIKGLEKIIEDFLFTEKKPFRDEVADIMNDKPSKLKEKNKIDLTSDKIITLAKLIVVNK